MSGVQPRRVAIDLLLKAVLQLAHFFADSGDDLLGSLLGGVIFPLGKAALGCRHAELVATSVEGTDELISEIILLVIGLAVSIEHCETLLLQKVQRLLSALFNQFSMQVRRISQQL